MYFIFPAINVRENFANDARIAASKNQARLVLRKHGPTATRNLATDSTTQQERKTVQVSLHGRIKTNKSYLKN